MLTTEHLDEFRQRISAVELVTIPGASHDLFRPDRLAYPKAVIEFQKRFAM